MKYKRDRKTLVRIIKRDLSGDVSRAVIQWLEDMILEVNAPAGNEKKYLCCGHTFFSKSAYENHVDFEHAPAEDKAPEKEVEKCGCGCHYSAYERELGIVKYCTKCINSYHLKIEEIEPLEPSWGDRTKINELVAAINSLAKRLKEVERK